MIQRILMIILLIGGLSGCDGTSLLKNDNPGTWGREKVEAQMLKSVRISSVTLTPSPGGGFEGTGQSDDGETFTITVKQDPSQKLLTYEFKSDRGSFGDGKVCFD